MDTSSSFINLKGEVRKFALTREACEALVALKPHVDLMQYEPDVWTEVRSEFKETLPEPPTDEPSNTEEKAKP